MIDFHNIKHCKLTDIAIIERAQAKEIYPAGTVYIQVSATRGQVKILNKPGHIESKYVTCIPHEYIYPQYFKISLEMAMPEFLARYQSTINIQVADFSFFEIDIHNDIETQMYIASLSEQCEVVINTESNIVKKLNEVKKIYLDKLMV